MERYLWPYVHRGYVELGAQENSMYGMHVNRQAYTYNKCLNDHAQRANWIAFTDIDESNVPKGGYDNAATVLEEEFTNYSGLVLYWHFFGPSDKTSSDTLQNTTSMLPFLDYEGKLKTDHRQIKIIVTQCMLHFVVFSMVELVKVYNVIRITVSLVTQIICLLMNLKFLLRIHGNFGMIRL